LTDGVVYYYRIQAYDEVPNFGNVSDEANGTPQDSEAPPQVNGLIATVITTGNTLNVSWAPSTASDVVGYWLYRSSFVVESFNISFNILHPTTYYVDTGLLNGVVYYYKVSAYDEVPNKGTNSTTASGTSADTTPPPQVTGLVVTNPGIGGQLILNWTEVFSSDLAGYRVYRNDSLVGSSTTNSFVDTGLINGAVYIYQVSAIDEVPNEGAQSIQQVGVPTAPHVRIPCFQIGFILIILLWAILILRYYMKRNSGIGIMRLSL
jgi:fibronectin type 3 domain-containing protein